MEHSLIVRAYLFLGVMEAVAAMAAFFYVLAGGGWQYEAPGTTRPALPAGHHGLFECHYCHASGERLLLSE